MQLTSANLFEITQQFSLDNSFLPVQQSELLTAIAHRFDDPSYNIETKMSSLDALLSTHFGKPGQTVNIQELTSSISQLQPPATTEDVAECIILLSHHIAWDGDSIGTAIKQANIEIDWERVLALIEHPTLFNKIPVLIDVATVGSLINVLKLLASVDEKLVLRFFSKKWKNIELQIGLVSACAYITPDMFDLKAQGLAQIVQSQDYSGASPQVRIVAESLIHQSLNFTCLIHYSLQALSEESESTKPSNATVFLDSFAKTVPELFFLGGVTIPKPWPELLERVIFNFFELFLVGNASSNFVFSRLAILDKPLFINALAQSFTRDPTLINRIFIVAQEANILNDLLSSNNVLLSLEIASIADKHGLLSFGSYLREHSKYKGPDFVRILLDFLGEKASLEYSQNQIANPLPGLNLGSVSDSLQFLNAVDIPPDCIEQHKAIQIQCLQSYPRLINYGQGYDYAILAHNDSNSFSPEVEREMKAYYQQMYEHHTEIRDIITMLQRLKQSSDPHDQDVFACMIHSLFDEYRFFPEYPLNALATTAVLFGSLVYFQLIDGLPLSIALRFILDSLRQPADSNMFKFGVQALFEFRERLTEYPKYCHVLLDIPGLAEHQQFFQKIGEIVGAIGGTQNTIIYNSISAALVVPDETIQEDPNQGIRDKVLFIVNNMASNNLQGKTKELVSILEKKYYEWFAAYIVGQRAKLEPNYHSLYISMLQIFGSRFLELYFVKVTYFQIVKLINIPDTATTPEKRNLLKNLGQWLGCLLLARNRPILHKNIAFKKLLCEGFDSQTLTCVLPFVCKILEKSANSTVFKAPNPWLMGIMKVLAELYQFADLTLNLKFEIEVLCNTLKVTLEEIQPSVIIRNHLAQDGIDGSQSVALNNEMHRLTLQDNQISSQPVPPLDIAPPSAISSFPDQQPQLPPQSEQQDQQSQLPSTISASIQTTPASVQFNEAAYIELLNHITLAGNSVFVAHPALKRTFTMAIEKALREVLYPAVERSVRIATLSTRSLVLKDFALEPDESKLRLAAQSVVRNLAGNYALVTAKDLLRDSLVSNLRMILMSHGYTETTLPADQIALAVSDNVDLISSIVERAAVDRSIAQIEEALQPAFLNRKNYMESGTTQPYAEQVSSYALNLPDPFRLKVGGPDSQQIAIYEEFGKARPPYENVLPDLSSQSQAPISQPQHAPQSLVQQSADTQPIAEHSFDAADPNSPRVLEHALFQIQSAVESIPKLCEESTEQSFRELSPEHRISQLISQILTVVDRHSFREQLIARTSQITVTLLFASELQFAREVLSFLLDQLCKLSSSTYKEITFWLLFSDDQRKFNAPVTLSILKSGLISCADLDVSLSKQVQGKTESVIGFTVDVITEAVLGSEPCALRADFAATLEALEEVAEGDPQYANVSKLMGSLSKNSQHSPVTNAENIPSTDTSTQTLSEQMRFIFAEWICLTQHPARNDRQLTSFIYQLSKHDILTTPEYAIAFVRLSFEFALSCYDRKAPQGSHPTSDEPLVALDSLAKLFSAILSSSKGDDTKARLTYAHRLLTVISFVLIEHHERHDEFNEQPYFRFFSSLLFELIDVETEEPEFSAELYLLLADIFKTLQPFAIPGFCFAWMSLVSHRYYLPKLLAMPEKRGWPYVIDFLCELLDFERTYVQGKDFPKEMSAMYQGTSRIFLALLHDCPQLFIEHHYVLCKHIPASFIQIRNLVLSAFPERMELPDPLTQGLKVDRLPEIKEIPIYAVDPSEDLTRFGLKKLVDSYVKSPSYAVLKGLASGFRLAEPRKESGLGFDIVTQDSAAFNSFAFYVGIKAVSSEKDKTATGSEEESSAQFNRDSPYLALLSNLLLELGVEGKYFLCEAMANQLRYPNRHTHFFSCVILSLFGNYGTSTLGANRVDVRHLITRVLLERIICNRPHPWGLMITFTELLKNSNYKFWDFPFTKSTPEIERMFASLYDHISNGSSSNTTTTNAISTTPTPTPTPSNGNKTYKPSTTSVPFSGSQDKPPL